MNILFALFNLGGWELVLVFAVIVLLFGAKKLPGLARGIGQSIKEYKKASNEEKPVEKSDELVKKL
ncbi:MAG: Sec-independent protein translocase subunit TatA/TatB [Limisphaerales bacterium]